MNSFYFGLAVGAAAVTAVFTLLPKVGQWIVDGLGKLGIKAKS